MAVEGVLIQSLNSEHPGCTQANQGCGEQHPAHQLKPLCEWRSHGLSDQRRSRRRPLKTALALPSEAAGVVLFTIHALEDELTDQRALSLIHI